ncbi:MAG: N-6 DNA methylase [Clostridiaceae bacterium]|nr:N-6 DNA methylase [Clostridiaceae bacterium]
MAKIKVKPEYKELVNMFNELTGSRSMWQVFNDCIEMFALSIQNFFTLGKKFIENEEKYKRISSQYSPNEIQTIVRIFAKITDMAEENPFRDLLGDLYMQLNMGSDALGQFFTPYNVSQLMSECSMDIDDIKSKIEEQGYVVINEPAVGGGANIIAFCEYMLKNDINYQTSCILVCQDLSRLTAMMCYVVLSLIGCSAVIKVGDTIANPFINYQSELAKSSELWTTPMFHLNNCYFKV